MEARQLAAQELATAERGAVLDKLIHKMVKSLIAADKAGCLSLAGPAILKRNPVLGQGLQGAGAMSRRS